jgi:hypothetical protein
MDKDLMSKKFQEDKELRDQVNANPDWRKAYGWAWDTITTVIERQKSRSRQNTFRSVRGRLFSIATQLVQAAEEMKKPNGERLSPYQEANVSGMKFRLFSPAPLYPELEEVQIADGLAEALEGLGPEDPFLKEVLGGRKPEEVAKELVGGTAMADVAARKQLFDGGSAAISASTDPMILLARKLSPLTAENRKWTEKYVSGPTTAASEALGKARFAVYGKAVNPDANFTLRLSYGTVKGYPMNGTQAPSKTTLYGLYDRALSFDNKGPWALPQRFVERESRLNLATPLDFVSTCDIIGGNSGSPVVNREGEFVGLIFDGNIESLPGRFLYHEATNRSVSVHPAAIIESLRKIYDANDLADEIEGVKK